MDSAARLRQRADKLREQLDNLKKEVTVANVNLQEILDRSISLVEEIESVRSTPIYLREYSRVQKILLDYVHAVTEINCTLEILTEGNETEIQTDDPFVVNATPPPPESNTAEADTQIVENQPEVRKSIDPKIEFKEKIERLAREDPDPKTEFREKVRELVKQDSKENNAESKPEPKNWMEALPFVPKAAVEAPPFVPKAAVEEPSFVPGASLVQKNVSIKFAPKITYVPNPGFFAPRIRQVPTPAAGSYNFPIYYAPSTQVISPQVITPQVISQPQTVSIISWNPPLPPQPQQYPSLPPQPQQYPSLPPQPKQYPALPSVPRRPVKIETPPNLPAHKILTKEEISHENAVETEAGKKEEKVKHVEAKKGNVPKVEEANLDNIKKTETVEKIKVESKVEPKPVEAKPEDVKPAEILTEKAEDAAIPEDIPEMEVSRKPGTKYQVVFDHLVSPSEFYVQILCPALSSMREMNKELKARFRDEKVPEQPYQSKKLSKREAKKLARKKIGKYGLCFTVDDPSWGRVEVVDWSEEENDDSITVFFMDYGDTKTVTLENIQPMPEKFRKYPRFAQRCHLADVYPLEAVPGKPLPPWSNSSATMFEILLDSMPHDFSCYVVVEEHDGCHDERSLPVTYFVSENGVSSSINDKMIEFESGKKLDGRPLPPDPRAEAVFYPETKTLNVGDLKVAPSPNLRKGEILPVQVTCLLKVNRFYCVKQGEEEENLLTKLVQFMNEPENVEGMLPCKDPPTVGQLVIGKYEEDNLWYRARVVKADPNSDRYKLLFLDYGNTEILSEKDIRKMEKKFLGFPFQLIECFLYRVEPSEGKTEEGMNYLYQKVDKGGLSIKICETLSEENNSYEVDLYDIDGKDVGLDLVVNKFARLTQT